MTQFIPSLYKDNHSVLEQKTACHSNGTICHEKHESGLAAVSYSVAYENYKALPL